jgi:hypothetical protein
MTDAEPQRDQPTDAEMRAAAGAEDYDGQPISDEEFAEVWEAPSARGGIDPQKSGGDMAGGDQAGTGGGEPS